MASPGMLRRVAVVRTDVVEECSASFIRVTGIVELRTMLGVTSNQVRQLLVTAKVPSSSILDTRVLAAISTYATQF
jgi:hypothetical protein